jgi:cytochrome c-type protein NapB
MSDSNEKKRRSLKATSLVVFMVATISASGFFMGLRQNQRAAGNVTRAGVVARPAIEEEIGPVSVVPRYTELAGGDWLLGSEWRTQLEAGGLPSPSLDDGASKAREEMVITRDQRRAYDGAPPVIPHPIHQTAPVACLVCHQQPTRIGDVIAPAMSHAEYPSCTQCHVPQSGIESFPTNVPMPKGQPPQGNAFVGRASAGPGQRAALGAPPVIPHGLQMRENCVSCHGSSAGSGPATTHPERANCLQCHALDAKLDYPVLVDYLKDHEKKSAEP